MLQKAKVSKPKQFNVKSSNAKPVKLPVKEPLKTVNVVKASTSPSVRNSVGQKPPTTQIQLDQLAYNTFLSFGKTCESWLVMFSPGIDNHVRMTIAHGDDIELRDLTGSLQFPEGRLELSVPGKKFVVKIDEFKAENSKQKQCKLTF